MEKRIQTKGANSQKLATSVKYSLASITTQGKDKQATSISESTLSYYRLRKRIREYGL